MNTTEPMTIAVNQDILEMEYAVRGPIPQRAAELRRQGRTTISCNIGNPQALGQKPMTFYRQILSLVEDPSRIGRERVLAAMLEQGWTPPAGGRSIEPMAEYCLDLSEDFLRRKEIGMGAYSESVGPLFIREAIARFIDRRDRVEASRGVSADPDNILLTNGASEGAKYLIDLLIGDSNDGIMIPIPQYPLYSAAIRKAGGVQVGYYLDEEAGWTLDRAILEQSLSSARKRGVVVKGIVVINPGNPTGAILGEETIRELIDFAADNEMVIIADEVYQENVYGATFVSFAEVLGGEAVPLFSLHSVSKGFSGECGHRGGYLEIRNPPRALGTELSFSAIISKQASVSLCPNTVGQLLVYLMVSPPEEGSAPYRRFVEERQSILDDLYEKATMIRKGFERMDSVECFGRTGAMYLFPRLDKLPSGSTDFDYCMSLLEATGLCTVNGSGFGQRAGTNHLRIAFLPSKEQIEQILPEWIAFHNQYVSRGSAAESDIKLVS